MSAATNRASPFSKAKLLLAASALTVAVVASFFCLRPSPPPPTTPGMLSREDSQQIARITRRAIWRTAFPDLSWQTIKLSPRSLLFVGTARIQQIEMLLTDKDVQVQIQSKFGPYFYWSHKQLQKSGRDAWEILNEGPSAVYVAKPYNGPESFGGNLSFGSSSSATVVGAQFARTPPAFPPPKKLPPRAPAPQAAPNFAEQPKPAPLSDSDFSASLSNHATLQRAR